MNYKAVFLDQNGTLVPDPPHTVKSLSTGLNEDVVEGLQRLQSYGYLLIVVSNKTGVADGESTMDEPDTVKGTLYNSCAHLGIYLDGFYVCPPGSTGTTAEIISDCERREPAPDLILRACDDLHIDLNNSWMVGDILNDVEAGNRAGCKSIMINNGNETKWESGAYRLPQYFARNLAEASRYIVATDNMKAEEMKLKRDQVYAYSSATPNQ